MIGKVLVVVHEDTDCTLKDDNSPTAANAIDMTGSGDSVGAAGKVDGFIVEMDNSASELIDYFLKNRTRQLKS